MWGWDPSQGEGPAGGTPTLLPTQSTSSAVPPPTEPHPLVVPDVENLKQQFQNQQNLLAQIKETVRENDADRTSKKKQLEMYANKLSQIKSRSKHAQTKTADPSPSPNSSPLKQSPRRASKENLSTPLTRRPSKENVSAADDSAKKSSSRGKMTELKKRLEENKLKFEEQTEREITETKKIESMVEHLKTQVKERNVTIHELQKTMDTPPSRPKVNTLPRRKDKPLRCSQWTQTIRINEKAETDSKVKELEAKVIDLEDTIKQQTSVISSRTQAVALLSEDLSKKSKSAVDDLEETRLEMRALQSNFVELEMKLKSELLDKDNRVAEQDETIRNLQLKNAQLQEMFSATEAQLLAANEKHLESENAIKLLEESATREENKFFSGDDGKNSDLEKKIEDLTKELDASNKLMIRLKLEHKNKLKAANKSLELLKKSSNDGGEILRLSTRVDELEAEKVKLESKIAELEEEKASEVDLNQRISDLENTVKQKDSEILSFEQLVSSYEAEKLRWQLCIEDQNILVDNLNIRIQNLEEGATFEPFEVPGDGASRQFDLSNKELQKQIEDLVAEKQGLLDKLKNLPSVSSTDSLTFEKVDLAGLETEIQASSVTLSTSAVPTESVDNITSLERSLLDEKQKTTSLAAKIEELEEYIKSIESSTENANVGSKGKNRFSKVQRELSNTKKSLAQERERIKELCDKLEGKEKLIKQYIEKLEVLEKDTVGSLDLSETQRKCLSLENSLIELTEHCERLRKENIELSEEKVRQKRIGEGMTKAVALVPKLLSSAAALEERIKVLELSTDVSELQASLEYCNVVIAGKDTEIFNLQSSLADKGQELDAAKEEYQKTVEALEKAEARIMLTTAAELDVKTLDEKCKEYNDIIASQNAKISDLEELCRTYAADLQKKSDECESLIEERHRLHVSLETVMADYAIASQALSTAEEKYSVLERSVQESTAELEQERARWKTCLKDAEERFCRERDEAVIKAEEAEKVLQKTWAERNELIQSKQDILLRFTETEKLLDNVKFERNQVEVHRRDLTRRLDEVGASQDLIDRLKHELELKESELERKKEEFNNLTLKAKKLAANLKKKAQIEKELTEQLNVALSEKVEMVGAGKEMAEKWATEGSEKENLLKEKELIQSQNAQLLEEKEELIRQNKMLVNETEAYIKEAEAAFLDKCAIEEEFIKQKEVCKVHEERISALDSEKNNLAEKLRDLENQWTLDKNELLALTDLYSKAQRELDTANARLGALEQTFELEEKENEALLSQKAALLQELETLKLKYREKKERLIWVENENEAMRSEHKLQIETLQRAQLDFSNQKEVLDQKGRDIEHQLSESLQTRDSLNNEIQHLRLSLQEATASADKFAEELNCALQRESNLNEEKNNLEVKLRTAQDDYSKEIGELKQNILMLQDTLNNKASDLLLNITHNRALQQEIDQCRNTIRSLQMQLEERNNALTTEVIRSNQVNDDLTNLRSLIADKDAEIARLIESTRVAAEEVQNKRKKSVTFKTDDGDYIRELRGEVHKLQEDLSEGREKIAELEMELVKEKTKEQETVVLTQELSQAPESHPDPSIFFRAAGDDFLAQPSEVNDPFSEESLAWDDGWGTEGHLEEAHALSKEPSVTVDPQKLYKLEKELEAMVNEKEKVDEEFRVLQVKYSKVVKKLKEQKLIIDRLQGEVKLAKSGMGGDLDAAMMDEVREEIKRVEARENEVRKELSAMKAEKESLLKRIDLLNAGNERFLEMKERQDSDVAVWQQKNAALLSEIADLQRKLQGPQPDDSEVQRENRELQNVVEGLEWKISELTELLEEKDELLAKKSNVDDADLQKQIRDTQNALDTANANLKLLEQQLVDAQHSPLTSLDTANERIKKLELDLDEERKSNMASQETLNDTELQLSQLATENETLQCILNDQKMKSSAKASDNQPQILHYFQKSSSSDFFESPTSDILEQTSLQNEKEKLEKESKELRYQLAAKQQELLDVLSERDFFKNQISELNNQLQMAEEDVQKLQLSLENEKIASSQHIEKILETLALKEAELDSASNAVNLLKQKEEEVLVLRNELAQVSSGTTVALLNEESWLAHDQLRDKEDQVEFLTQQVQDLQKAYNDAKSEIERLLNEERLRSETPLDDNFVNTRRSIDLERGELETAVRAKDNELSSLKECLVAAEAELEDARKSNDLVVQQLKAQLRQFDSESAHCAEEKDTEIAELRAEVTELQDLIATKALEVRSLRDELSLHSKKQEEDNSMLLSVRSVLEEREYEAKKLKEAVENLELVIVEKDAEIAELRLNLVAEVDVALKLKEMEQELSRKEEEVRALKETLQSVHTEMSQFRSFDKQMRDLQGRPGDTRTQSNIGGEGNQWNAEENMQLAGRLQSDLDTALYMLHQRDVRCEELTFELMQLLEERDTLQLRLSTVIRTYEDLKSKVEAGDRSPSSSSSSGGTTQNLTEKISELHSVGYARDKNIQDESLQRHREQMALLNRDSRGNSRPVMDV